MTNNQHRHPCTSGGNTFPYGVVGSTSHLHSNRQAYATKAIRMFVCAVCAHLLLLLLPPLLAKKAFAVIMTPLAPNTADRFALSCIYVFMKKEA